MTAVAIGAFVPDASAVDTGTVVAAANVFPAANGYAPVKGLSAVTSALPGACKGAIRIKNKTGETQFYAGTQTGLYKYDPVTLGWTNVSRAGSTYFVPDDDYWSFALYGNLLHATHVNDGVQVINVDVGTQFSTLGGSPPRARFLSVVGDFLVLGGLVDYPKRIQWSGLNDSTFWTPGLNFSDVQDFPDGGDVTGMAGGEFGIVFQESAIRQMTFAPGTAEIFQFSRLEDSKGAVSPWSIVRVGARTFFLDRDGFHVFTGVSNPIGAGKINNWFVANADQAYIKRIVASADVRSSRVFWAFKSSAASSPDVLDRVLIYDWNLDRWSYLTVSIRYLVPVATPGVSIDSITSSIDALTTSLDSAIYLGGVPSVGAFTDTTNTLSFFEGSNLEAMLETVDAQIGRPGRAYVRGIRVDTDSTDARVTLGAREGLGASVTWGVEGSPEITGVVPFHSSSRYHRARVRIPAGTAWTYLSGLDVDARPEGFR